MNKCDIYKKPININKKITSNRTKHTEAEKKIVDLTNKVAQISAKGYYFLLGRMYFTGNDGYENFLVIAPMPNSLTLDSNRKVTNWISTGISSEYIKLFDTDLEPTMSNLAKGRVNLKLKTLF